MRKSAFYSRPPPREPVAHALPADPAPEHPSGPSSRAGPAPGWLRGRRFSFADPRILWGAIGLLSLALIATLLLALRPGARALTQDDINAAVLHTLENTPLPSPAVRVIAAPLDGDPKTDLVLATFASGDVTILISP